MARSKVPSALSASISASYRALVLGVVPVLVFVSCFELLTPENLLADGITIGRGAVFLDSTRLIFFLSIGTVHILICAVVALLSIHSVLLRLSKSMARPFIVYSVIFPILLLAIGVATACSRNPKIYRISYGRVSNLLRQSADFSYQFEVCERHDWLRVVCPSGNLHIGLFVFLLIIFGLAACVCVSADIGVSSLHHGKPLSPGRLVKAGREMQDDINRYAVSLLVVLTSSSTTTAAFQPLGSSLLKSNTVNAMLYEKAATAAALFWPLAFTSIFLGIAVVPALSVMSKRSEAHHLLDDNEISRDDYEGFFAVQEAMPQTLKWMAMSGLPLLVSLIPRFAGLTT